MTPSGIEPATFRFVAQHLNYLTNRGPRFLQVHPVCVCVCVCVCIYIYIYIYIYTMYHIEVFLDTFYVGVQNFNLLIFQIVIHYSVKHYFTADS